MFDDENGVAVPEGSVREALVEAFKGSTKADESSSPAESAPADKPKAEAQSAQEPEAKTEVKPAASAQAKDDKSADDGAKPLEAPARWTKTQKEWFAGLDRANQEKLLELNKELQGGYTKKSMEAAQLQQRLASIDGLLAPRRQQWAQNGWDDARALNMLFAYWDLAQRDPMAFIHNFAQERGMDMATLFAPQQRSAQPAASGADGTPPSALPPEVVQQMEELRRQNQALFQHVNQLTGVVDKRAQAERAQLVEELSAELRAFQEAADASGSPLHPFFPEVRADMAQLMQIGKAKTLQEAYELAIRINPDAYAKVEESREIERRRADEHRRAEEAERAKRAGAMVSSTSTDYSSPPSGSDDDLSIRGLLKRGFEQARGGDQRI